MEKQDYFPIGYKKDINALAKRFMPSLYRIWLINNNQINEEVLSYILKNSLHVAKHQINAEINKLRNRGYLSYGNLTKEIAEEKISDIRNLVNVNGYNIKCLVCKDEKYVIKKP